jgi:hypothetical protein
MKKSKAISLVLITAALASCNKKDKTNDWEGSTGGKTYVRGDSTAPYSRSHHTGLWFYAFRPSYGYYNGNFTRRGFYSDAISHKSNVGTNASKATAVRGGFGRSSRVGS